MASQGKRMVPEYLIKYLEGLYNSGIDPTGFQPKLTAGEGIAIDEDNEITYDSETAAPLMENIVDSAGNKRFVEFDGTYNEISGVSIDYCKASLSGTHLMFVVAGNIDNGTILAQADLSISFDVPEWLGKKIYPLSGTKVEIKNILFFDSQWNTQNTNFGIGKISDTNFSLVNLSSFTANTNRSFRIQFDLLIDTEYSE